MPATKNKKVSPPKRGKRPSPTKNTKQNEEKAAANRQLAAIILFVVSVFFICLSFINGGGLWGGLRTLSFGLFGFSAFIWPLVLIYVAVMATLDKTDQKIGVKIFEAAMLIILLSAAIHIFGFHGVVDFSENVIDAYNAYRFDGSLVDSGYAIFEATHGTAPNIAGKNVVNPCSLLLSSVMMLEYMGWNEVGRLITAALEHAFSEGKATRDLARFMQNGQPLGTKEFGEYVMSIL